jgi:hypothetical protein
MTAGANWDEHIIATARSAFYLANGEYRGAAEKVSRRVVEGGRGW